MWGQHLINFHLITVFYFPYPSQDYTLFVSFSVHKSHFFSNLTPLPQHPQPSPPTKPSLFTSWTSHLLSPPPKFATLTPLTTSNAPCQWTAFVVRGVLEERVYLDKEEVYSCREIILTPSPAELILGFLVFLLLITFSNLPPPLPPQPTCQWKCA